MAKDGGFAGGVVLGALLARAAKPRPAGELGRNLDRAMYIRLNNKHPIPAAQSKPSKEVLDLIEQRDNFARSSVAEGAMGGAYKRLSQELMKDIKGAEDAIKGISDPNATHLRSQLLRAEEARLRAEIELRVFGQTGVVEPPEDNTGAPVATPTPRPQP